jgi:transposase
MARIHDLAPHLEAALHTVESVPRPRGIAPADLYPAYRMTHAERVIRTEKIVRMRQKGMTQEAIGKHFNLSPQRIAQILKVAREQPHQKPAQAAIKAPPRGLRDEQRREYLIALRETGMREEEIASFTGVSWVEVRYLLTRRFTEHYGVQLRQINGTSCVDIVRSEDQERFVVPLTDELVEVLLDRAVD